VACFDATLEVVNEEMLWSLGCKGWGRQCTRSEGGEERLDCATNCWMSWNLIRK
jgi:hypothetical protein